MIHHTNPPADAHAAKAQETLDKWEGPTLQAGNERLEVARAQVHATLALVELTKAAQNVGVHVSPEALSVSDLDTFGKRFPAVHPNLEQTIWKNQPEEFRNAPWDVEPIRVATGDRVAMEDEDGQIQVYVLSDWDRTSETSWTLHLDAEEEADAPEEPTEAEMDAMVQADEAEAAADTGRWDAVSDSVGTTEDDTPPAYVHGRGGHIPGRCGHISPEGHVCVDRADHGGSHWDEGGNGWEPAAPVEPPRCGHISPDGRHVCVDMADHRYGHVDTNGGTWPKAAAVEPEEPSDMCQSVHPHTARKCRQQWNHIGLHSAGPGHLPWEWSDEERAECKRRAAAEDEERGKAFRSAAQPVTRESLKDAARRAAGRAAEVVSGLAGLEEDTTPDEYAQELADELRALWKASVCTTRTDGMEPRDAAWLAVARRAMELNQ